MSLLQLKSPTKVKLFVLSKDSPKPDHFLAEHEPKCMTETKSADSPLEIEFISATCSNPKNLLQSGIGSVISSETEVTDSILEMASTAADSTIASDTLSVGTGLKSGLQCETVSETILDKTLLETKTKMTGSLVEAESRSAYSQPETESKSAGTRPGSILRNKVDTPTAEQLPKNGATRQVAGKESVFASDKSEAKRTVILRDKNDNIKMSGEEYLEKRKHSFFSMRTSTDADHSPGSIRRPKARPQTWLVTDQADLELRRVLDKRRSYIGDFDKERAEKNMSSAEKAVADYERRLDKEKRNRLSKETTIIVDSQVSKVLAMARQRVDQTTPDMVQFVEKSARTKTAEKSTDNKIGGW